MHRSTEYCIILFMCVLALSWVNHRRAPGDMFDRIASFALIALAALGMAEAVIWQVFPERPTIDYRFIALGAALFGAACVYCVRSILDRSEARRTMREFGGAGR